MSQVRTPDAPPGDLTKEIDPGRPSIGKGLLWTTGSFGCERESWYGETIRDAKGWRLQHPMPERVHFGKAIDLLHAILMRRRAAGLPDPYQRLDDAVDMAYHAGVYGPWDEEPDRDTFRVQIENAARLLVGEVAGPPEQAPGVPIEWVPLEGLHIQGMDGKTLEIPGVFGDRPLGGTPDYVWTDTDGVLHGWADVKAVSRSMSYPSKWLQAEPSIYTYLLMRLNEGVLPGFAAYIEYRRLAKPYWSMTVLREPGLLARIAGLYINRWQKALANGDPDLLSFNPSECSDCPYRRPIPEVQFSGCPIGQIVGEGVPPDPPEEGAPL
jgi:hypothetical protein